MVDEIVELVLKKAGWSEDHSYDISDFIETATRRKCEIPEVVIDFLKKFGDLHIRYPYQLPQNLADKYGIKTEIKNFNLDPIQVEMCNDLIAVSQRLGVENLYSVGEWDTYFILMMSNEGAVYAMLYPLEHNDYIWLIGENTEQTIQALCTNQGIIKLDA